MIVAFAVSLGVPTSPHKREGAWVRGYLLSQPLLAVSILEASSLTYRMHGWMHGWMHLDAFGHLYDLADHKGTQRGRLGA